jgi:hypothetical protein
MHDTEGFGLNIHSTEGLVFNVYSTGIKIEYT